MIVQCDGTRRCLGGRLEASRGASWFGRGYFGYSSLSSDGCVYVDIGYVHKWSKADPMCSILEVVLNITQRLYGLEFLSDGPGQTPLPL